MTAREPLALRDLSAVGFGCYRIATVEPHERALERALALGCNLFDTAATYTGGKSEQALGKVLRAHAGRSFVVTKAGYCDEETAAKYGVEIAGEETRHSLHPDFLRARLATSTARLGAPPDALLLHNPERLFGTPGLDEGRFYAMIASAFETLEEQAQSGQIRYYGVSSNALRASGGAPHVALDRLLAAARSVSPTPRFRIIQCPFNFYELEAASTAAGPSLIAAARAAGLTTLGNRPLNAVVDGEPRRIATYGWQLDRQARRAGAEAVEALRNAIARILEERFPGVETGEAPALQFLAGMWESSKDPEFIEYLLLHHVDPIAGMIADEAARGEFLQLRQAARQALMRHALHLLSEQGEAVREALIRSGHLRRDDDAPLALAACREYLALGIDHVLVGMRRLAYVDQLQPLFGVRQTRPPAAAPVVAAVASHTAV